MTPLLKILHAYRSTSQTEREKGNDFEELIRSYFRYEASYAGSCGSNCRSSIFRLFLVMVLALMVR